MAPTQEHQSAGKTAGILIRYRLLHELRRAFSRSGTFEHKVGFLMNLLLLPAAVAIAWSLNTRIVSAVRLHIQADGDHPWPALAAGTALAGSLFLMVAVVELMREIAFAPERGMLQVAPVTPSTRMLYSLGLAVLRILPLASAMALFPVQLSLGLSLPQFPVPAATLIMCCLFAWLLMLALLCALVLLAASRRLRLRNHTLFTSLYVAVILATIPVSAVTVNLDWWRGLVHRFGNVNPGAWTLGAGIAALVLSVPLLYRACVRLWPGAASLEEHSIEARHADGSSVPYFPQNASGAIFRKDLKDLTRNPAYRQALAACAVLLLLVLWSQARGASSMRGGSRQRMMTCLSLLYLIPLLISARTVSLELRMLDLYRLLLPGVDHLLDLKLKVQAVVNSLLVIALSLPIFLFTAQGRQPFHFHSLVLLACLFTPLLTMLALGLGTLFPCLQPAPQPIGMKLKGVLAYSFLALPLYSFLLNRMYVGSAIYSAVLVLVTLATYWRARKVLRAADLR